MKKRSRSVSGWNDQPACKWLQNLFQTHDPVAVRKEIILVLKNETAAVGLFKAISGLSVIAGCKGDKKGSSACADSLVVLANIRHNIAAISEDFDQSDRKDLQ